MNDRRLAIRRLFGGFDRVTVERDLRENSTLVRLTIFDETLDSQLHRRVINLSSQNSERALEHRAGSLRFYGRKGERRGNRGRFR